MPIGLDFFQLQVGQWANETFPKATPHTIARHLFREAVELCIATMPVDLLRLELRADLLADVRAEIAKDAERGGVRVPQDVLAESADIILLALHLAHKAGFSLLAVAHTKHEENRARAWGEADAAGVVEHVREEG
jgi:hypothetical protein